MTKPKRYKRFSSEFKREAIMRASNKDGDLTVPNKNVILRLAAGFDSRHLARIA